MSAAGILAVVGPGPSELLAPASPTVAATAVLLILSCVLIQCLLAAIERDRVGIHKDLGRVPDGWTGPAVPPRARLAADAPTAVLLVDGYDAAGMKALLAIGRLFPGLFSQVVLLSIRPFDATDEEGRREAGELRASTARSLARYSRVADLLQVSPAIHVALGDDPLRAGVEAAIELSAACPRSVFFLPRVVISPARWYDGLLVDGTPRALDRRLARHGLVTFEIPLFIRRTVTASDLRPALPRIP